MYRGVKYFSLAVLLLALQRTSYSQSTFATITGTVADSTGAVVPKVTISATNLETNIKTTTESNETGNYIIAQLKEGTYSVKAQAPGFKEFVAENVTVVARDIRRVDINLVVGPVGASVEVSGGATLIETETARISDIKSETQLKMVPLNTRALWPILTLTPGLVQGADTSHVRFSGSRANEENWSIDGTSFSDGVDNTQMGPIANYIESYQEVKVDLANNSAEFASLGQVTIITKSGTNTLHGSIYDYYSTPSFRARDPFALVRGTGVYHAPGGSVGGPVYLPKLYKGKNRTFFFYSYETFRGSQQTDLFNPTVPVAAWQQGDFSNILPTVIYDPKSGMPFPGNKIPASRINPVSQTIQQQFYPLPNFGDITSPLESQNYRQTLSVPYNTQWMSNVRIDHKFSDKDSIFGRVSWQQNPFRDYEDNLPTFGRINDVRRDRAATVSYTHIFTPTIYNEFRYGYGFNNDVITGPINGLKQVQSLGLTGLAPNLPNITGVFNVAFNDVGIQPIAENYGTYVNPGYRNHREEFQEQFSWFRHRHNLKFGFNLGRIEWDDYSAPSDLFGSVNFSNRFTGLGQPAQGNDYADFLLGIPTTSSRSFPPLPLDRHRWEYDLFATDEFKVSPRLTLSLGVRYQIHPSWQEKQNQIANFDIATGQIVVPDGSLSRVNRFFPTNYVGIVQASSVGFSGKSLIKTDMNNIAPRIGIAYRPWGNKTVFRAGYGIFYDGAPFWDYGIGGVPWVLSQPAYTNTLQNPIVLPTVFPATNASGPSTVSIPKAVNPNLRIPYSMQYNFTIERQQWNTGFRVSYIGTNTRQGYYQYDYNSPIPNGQPYIDKPRPFPNLPDILYLTNGAGHQYNGLTVMAQRQLTGGLLYQASWTWARDRYDEDYNWDLSGEYYTLEDPFNRHRDVGPSKDIPTYRFTSNVIYQLPFGKGRHWLSGVSRVANLVVGGWQISGIFATFSGQFLTPLWTGPDPVGIEYTTGAPAIVTIRPDVLQNPNLPNNQRSVGRWFNVNAFAPPQLGSFGTSGRGVIKGPGLTNVDAGLFKQVFIRENGPRLWWEFTATNAFNHPNWSNPDVNISDQPGAGVIYGVGGVNGRSTGDQAGPRTLRMGLRFEW